MRFTKQISTDYRAQSYTIGTVLLIGIALLATVGAAASAFVILDQSQQQLQEDRAEHALSEFTSEMSLVALDNTTNNGSFDLGMLQGESVTVTNHGTVRVEAIDESTGDVDEVLVEESLGEVKYSFDGSDKVIVSQGGGVWKHHANGTTQMVSPPEMHYRNKTLTFPLMLINSDGSTDNIASNGRLSSEPASGGFPTESTSNPLETGAIRVTIESDYYRGWGSFFDERVGGEVSTDHESNTASVTFSSTERSNQVGTALQASSSGSGVTIRGGGGEDSFIDSYDSSEGDYESSQSENGVLQTAGDVELRGGANIFGDVVIPEEYSVDARGNSEVTGEIRNDSLESSSIDRTLRSHIDEIADTNDNPGTSEITSSNTLDPSQSTWELDAGTYYLESDLSIDDGETLDLDTSDGNIRLAVEGDVSIDGDVNVVSEEDSNRVRIFTGGTSIASSGGNVDVPGDASNRFWIFGSSGMDISFTNGAELVGVVYAPDDTGSGSVELRSQSSVYGGVIGGVAELQSGGSIHYDQNLEQSTIFEEGFAQPVTYVHVSVNKINVTD